MKLIIESHAHNIFDICSCFIRSIDGGANLVSAQQYNTFYSPEKRFAIDHPIFDSKDFSINDTSEQTRILTSYIFLLVNMTPNTHNVNLKERTDAIQESLHHRGFGIITTTEPILVDHYVGYRFVVSGIQNMTDVFLYVEHDDIFYQFQIAYTIGFGMDFSHYVNHDKINQVILNIAEWIS